MFEDGISEMLASIESRGYYECKQVVSSKTAERLRAYMDTQYEQDQFKKAGVGKGASLVINESIRKDSILWIEREPKNELVADYASFVSELIPQLNRHFFLPLKDKELMYAIYEKGSFYKKHRDRFIGNQHRFFTVVLYLTDWQEGDGGELVIYKDDTQIKVTPTAGTFIIFMSEMEHEVLPALARRYSITGWVTDVPIGLTFL
ncbi:MAG TPA: oxidoreductase [Bacteroidetes bacterium]|nr:oxidoreductase [Bacteroidota bacterium]